MPSFDARTAKALAAGDHLTIDEAPGLRLAATATRRTWTYRYKSPVDQRMRQLRLGHWPAMSYAAALAAWETARQTRAGGADPALDARLVLLVERVAMLGVASGAIETYNADVLRAANDLQAAFVGVVSDRRVRAVRS